MTVSHSARHGALPPTRAQVSRPKDVTRLVTTSGQKVRVTAEDLEAGKAVVDVVRAVSWGLGWCGGGGAAMRGPGGPLCAALRRHHQRRGLTCMLTSAPLPPAHWPPPRAPPPRAPQVLLPASAPLGDLPAPEDECVHTVQEGDTVFDIAKVRPAYLGRRRRRWRWSVRGAGPGTARGSGQPLTSCPALPCFVLFFCPAPQKYGTTVDSLKALNPELQDANFLRLGEGGCRLFVFSVLDAGRAFQSRPPRPHLLRAAAAQPLACSAHACPGSRSSNCAGCPLQASSWSSSPPASEAGTLLAAAACIMVCPAAAGSQWPGRLPARQAPRPD